MIKIRRKKRRKRWKNDEKTKKWSKNDEKTMRKTIRKNDLIEQKE